MTETKKATTNQDTTKVKPKAKAKTKKYKFNIKIEELGTTDTNAYSETRNYRVQPNEFSKALKDNKMHTKYKEVVEFKKQWGEELNREFAKMLNENEPDKIKEKLVDSLETKLVDCKSVLLVAEDELMETTLRKIKKEEEDFHDHTMITYDDKPLMEHTKVYKEKEEFIWGDATKYVKGELDV